MNYSFLALQFSPPLMYPRGSIYSTPNRKWRVASEHSQVIWKEKSQFIQESMRKTPKKFGFMHISLCTWVLAQKLHVHAGISLKVVYTHKWVFLGTFLGHQSIIWEKGVQGVCKGIWKTIKMWSTKCGKIIYNKWHCNC